MPARIFPRMIRSFQPRRPHVTRLLRATRITVTLPLALAALLSACSGDGDGGTEPETPSAYRVTALTENLSCTAQSCGVDVRGVARTSAGDFVSNALVFTYVGAAATAGPQARTNANGAYVLRVTVPATPGTYRVRVCAGNAVRPADGQCPEVNFVLS